MHIKEARRGLKQTPAHLCLDDHERWEEIKEPMTAPAAYRKQLKDANLGIRELWKDVE